MLACTVGNLDIVKLLLMNSTTDVNVVDKSGINALYVSVYYGHLEIVQLLRKCGAKFQPSDNGTTILHVAVKKGYVNIVKYLLYDCKDQHKNMPIDSEKHNGITPVFLSAQYNHLIILKMLREAGANL